MYVAFYAASLDNCLSILNEPLSMDVSDDELSFKVYTSFLIGFLAVTLLKSGINLSLLGNIAS